MRKCTRSNVDSRSFTDMFIKCWIPARHCDWEIIRKPRKHNPISHRVLPMPQYWTIFSQHVPQGIYPFIAAMHLRNDELRSDEFYVMNFHISLRTPNLKRASKERSDVTCPDRIRRKPTGKKPNRVALNYLTELSDRIWTSGSVGSDRVASSRSKLAQPRYGPYT